jgi:hypothetical protein
MPPPAPVGTTIVTVRDGKSCAVARGALTARSAKAAHVAAKDMSPCGVRSVFDFICASRQDTSFFTDLVAERR